MKHWVCIEASPEWFVPATNEDVPGPVKGDIVTEVDRWTGPQGQTYLSFEEWNTPKVQRGYNAIYFRPTDLTFGAFVEHVVMPLTEIAEPEKVTELQ